MNKNAIEAPDIKIKSELTAAEYVCLNEMKNSLETNSLKIQTRKDYLVLIRHESH